MAKKKGSLQQTGGSQAVGSEQSPADLYPEHSKSDVSCMEFASTPSAEFVEAVNSDLVDMCADLASKPLSEVTDECDDATECIEALNEWAEATNSAEGIQSEPAFVDTDSDDEIAAISTKTDLTVSSASNKLVQETASEVYNDEGVVNDLVAQQLRQMFEDGGATATSTSAGSFTGTHSMNLQVKAGAVDMNLSTMTEANQEVVELRAQIELQKKLLEDAQARLDAANQRIGFLEAFVAQKDQLLEEKKEQSNWLKSLFGL